MKSYIEPKPLIALAVECTSGSEATQILRECFEICGRCLLAQQGLAYYDIDLAENDNSVVIINCTHVLTTDCSYK